MLIQKHTMLNNSNNMTGYAIMFPVESSNILRDFFATIFLGVKLMDFDYGSVQICHDLSGRLYQLESDI